MGIKKFLLTLSLGLAISCLGCVQLTNLPLLKTIIPPAMKKVI